MDLPRWIKYLIEDDLNKPIIRYLQNSTRIKVHFWGLSKFEFKYYYKIDSSWTRAFSSWDN